MKKFFLPLVLLSVSIYFLSCSGKDKTESAAIIKEMNLKRGELISCGPSSKEFGTLESDLSCNASTRDDFNLGIKLLHSFEYDEAEKVFAGIIEEQPECAMAYWGVAMSNFHPLWTPPTEDELVKGTRAIEFAKKNSPGPGKETDYINAVASFYTDWKTLDHRTRTLNFEKAMEQLYSKYPDDNETAIFYALSMTAAADPADKTYSRQLKAGNILNDLHTKIPNHPGVVHYIIHTYDSPEMAGRGLEAARKYAALASSSAHALHMPSHIFTRLGLWDESIKTNIASVSSAKCYAESSGIKGHWDEELHSLDYLMYAYLQNGQNTEAKKQWDYLKSIKAVYPDNFKVSYSFASIPARYLLENKRWSEAAVLEPHISNYSFEKFPWQKSIIHFTRLLGAVNTGNLEAAKTELKKLEEQQQKLLDQKDAYKANQVAIQAKMGEAWIRFREGKNTEALALMNQAVDMEDKTDKHPVTPGEVLPARELLADMLLAMNQPAKALVVYEADLKKHPNRFNSVYGAGLSAERSGDLAKAKSYYDQLIKHSDPSADRPEITLAKKTLN
jgi:hypothetical protein